MRRTFSTLTAASLLAGALLAGDRKVRVLVSFKGPADPALIQQLGGEVERPLAGGLLLAARVDPARLVELRFHPEVLRVEQDGVVTVFGGKNEGNKNKGNKNKKNKKKKKKGGGGGQPKQPGQTVPWNVTRVGGNFTAAGIKLAIIDTGIDGTHVDLAANYKGGVNFVSPGRSPADDHGHGTHVAGIAAAVNNTVGLVGVAQDASLYAVKVLNWRGSGYWSWVAAGIDWTWKNGMNVANMSLGSTYAPTSIKTACDTAAQKGVLLVAAAGNNGDGRLNTNEYSYPAAFSSVVGVAAVDSSNRLAWFSATNPTVELAAPGVSITSTFPGNRYATMSGTSMASPHAAGCAAVLWKALGTAASPATVRAKLQSLAIDLGPTGRDNGYGYGLVQHGQ